MNRIKHIIPVLIIAVAVAILLPHSTIRAQDLPVDSPEADWLQFISQLNLPVAAVMVVACVMIWRAYQSTNTRFIDYLIEARERDRTFLAMYNPGGRANIATELTLPPSMRPAAFASHPPADD